MKIKFSLRGMDKMRSNLKKSTAKISDEIAISMDEIGRQLLLAAESMCPTDQGHLRESLTLQIRRGERRTTAIVGPDVDYKDTEGEKPANYAVMVEFGSANNPAQPFLRPALALIKSRVQAMSGGQ